MIVVPSWSGRGENDFGARLRKIIFVGDVRKADLEVSEGSLEVARSKIDADVIREQDGLDR